MPCPPAGAISAADPPVRSSESIRGTPVRDRLGRGAFAAYLLLSALFFARPLFGHWTAYHFGPDVPSDSLTFVWSMLWWRHALLHHLNPFTTDLLWAPGVTNLAWVTLAPLAAILAIPATGVFGPLATCNAVFLLAPALSAWAAFILCRHLCGRYLPSLAGGYIFGFSAFTLGQIQGHLHQVLAFPIPIVLYLAIRRYEGSLRGSLFVPAMALAVAAQFLLSMETLASMALFGGCALAIALAVNPGAARRLMGLGLMVALACALAAVMVSPFILHLLRPAATRWGTMYSADPTGFLLPIDNFEIGRLWFFKALAARLPPNGFEADTYLGPVLIFIAILYARRHWREPFPRAMLYTAAVIILASLGPEFRVLGHYLFPLPGAILRKVPLMGMATAARFAVYAHLIFAIIAAIWFSETEYRPPAKAVIAGLLGISLLPNLASSHWTTATRIPAFFADGLYRKYLSPGEIVIALPYWLLGDGMLWQAQSDFYFKTAGAWTGPPPAEFNRWPIVAALATNMLPPHPDLQLKAFVAAHDVGAVIAGPKTNPMLRPMLLSLDPDPTEIGGVTLYRVKPEAIATYRNLTARAMATRAARERLDTLIIAADHYLAAGEDPAKLNPKALERLGLIPAQWAPYDSIVAFNALWVARSRDGGVDICISASSAALAPWIEKYRTDASALYYPYPAPYRPDEPLNDDPNVFVVSFDRAGLARAAAAAAASPDPPRARP